MKSDPKFITDASLSGLAKWLRLLGFDTIVYSGKAGRPMMRQSAGEHRILLTRRRDMLERQFSGEAHLLPPGNTGEQLSFIISKLSLEVHFEKMFRICLICNSRLHPVVRENAQDLVPPYVFENCREFNQCDQCGKIYWPGTHGRNALLLLNNNNITIL